MSGKNPKGELHSPIRFTTASTAPSFLYLSLLKLYKRAAKERHKRNVPQDVQPKRRKACVNKNMRIKPYNYYYNYRQTLP